MSASTTSGKAFPAKVLLFGEYTVIAGSQALAMPFPAYKAVWSMAEEADIRLPGWLPDFASYLHMINPTLDPRHRLDLELFRSDMETGWSLQSDIPVGKGVGSSGALVAAVFSKYCEGPEDWSGLDTIRGDLARIESFFHGSSSGLDPLVSYLQRAVRIDAAGSPALTAIPDSISPASIFLWDSGRERRTKSLVKHFHGLMEEPSFRDQLQKDLLPYVDSAIEACIDGIPDQLISATARISEFQWTYFQPMIAPEVSDIWKEGLESELYYVKLCGAGGGGFYFLSFENDPAFRAFRNRHGDAHPLIPVIHSPASSRNA